MWPVIFSIGDLHVFSYSLLMIIAWAVMSFLFWRHLKNQAVSDETIFRIMFGMTIAAIIGARLAFVALHPQLFTPNWLRVFTLWVQPGLSLYGALVGMLGTLVYYAIADSVRLAYVLDAFAISYSGGFIVGSLASLLDGTVVGKVTRLPCGVWYVGQLGRRHPVQLYEILTVLCIVLTLTFLVPRIKKRDWAAGHWFVWFFLCSSLFLFPIEFAKESAIYFGGLSLNQWVLVMIFAESLGALYMKAGGKEWLKATGGKIGAYYAEFSKRRSH